MTAIRFVACPTRQAGESGRAFVERMLRELNAKKGSATALPTPPKIEITATTAKVAKEVRANVETISRAGGAASPADAVANPGPAAIAEPEPEPKSGTAPSYVNDCEAWRLAAEKSAKAGKVVLDWRGRPDHRPTTRCWPPGPIGPDGRSTHRYVGPWPPKWASKWTKNPKKA
jgi:hypothetical protein